MIDLSKAKAICEAATRDDADQDDAHQFTMFALTALPQCLEEIERLRSRLDSGVYKPDSLLSQIDSLRKQCEQLTVQLSGCGAAALGWCQSEPAKVGDYGWSASYQDVLNLRKRLELAEAVCNIALENQEIPPKCPCRSCEDKRRFEQALQAWRDAGGGG